MPQERARRSTAAAKNDPYTLIVALDGNMHAEGEIYLDDGSSFAYKRGLYAHRAFTFSNGVLSNKQMPGTMGKYDSDLLIERIIVVGLDKPAAWSVVDTETSSALEAGPGPLVMQPGIPDAALVIRKPELPVAREWSVKFAGAGKAQTQ
jgi:alpha 1,3-glucosidase